MITNKKTRATGYPLKRQMPLVMLGAGFVLIIVILSNFFPMTGTREDHDSIQVLEERVAFLEQRLQELTPTLERLNAADAPGSQLERLNTSYQRLEASLTLKSNLLAERMDALEARARETRANLETFQAKTPIARSEAKKIAVQPLTPAPRHHVVEKGDTFYSISKRYDVGLKRLREINKFDEKTVIYPGQKIIIEP